MGDQAACGARLAGFLLGSPFGRLRNARYRNVHRTFRLDARALSGSSPFYHIRKRKTPIIRWGPRKALAFWGKGVATERMKKRL